jgi:hypothetical protein
MRLPIPSVIRSASRKGLVVCSALCLVLGAMALVPGSGRAQSSTPPVDDLKTRLWAGGMHPILSPSEVSSPLCL